MGGDILFILALLLCIGLLIYTNLAHSVTLPPLPEDSTIRCPSRAQYTTSGGIVSEPGGKFFTSMDSYSQYYKYLASAGIDCSFITPTRNSSQLAQSQPKDVNVTQEDEQTYATTPINKLDDYEFSRVFSIEKESRNELERTTINALASRFQFDWSQLPFNSQVRATQETAMNQQRLEGFTGTLTEPFYESVSGDNMAPQDLQDIDEREKAILQQYSPKKTEDLLEHDTDDVQVLVKKLYENDPDYEPVVEKVKDGEFEVTKLIPKRKKKDSQFEDEDVPTVAEAIEKGLAKGGPKVQPRMEVSGMQDPYFDKTGVLDYEGDRFYRYDQFAKWTPGLERMFAPTFDQNDWVGESPQSTLSSPDYTSRTTQAPYAVADNSASSEIEDSQPMLMSHPIVQ